MIRHVVLIKGRGELPYSLMLDGYCFGIFRRKRDAVQYLGEILGVDFVGAYDKAVEEA